jgi:hypothetical protein
MLAFPQKLALPKYWFYKVDWKGGFDVGEE